MGFEQESFPALERLRALLADTGKDYEGFGDLVMTENQLIQTSLGGVASGLSSTLANALAGGKLDFESFARSAAASLAQIIIQQQIIKALGFFGFADGGVVEGGAKTFATGGVVNRPTLFAMGGGGLGLMGEAGAEAIMPLKRDKAGRLGVAATGAQGGGGVTINVTNNAENSPANDRRLARVISQQVAAAWNLEARKQMQPGGTLNAIGNV